MIGNMSGNGTDKIRFEYCLENMRSVQGHSGGQQFDPELQNIVLVSYGWSDSISHVGSSFDFRSICEGGLIADGTGIREEGRQTRFFTVQSIPWQYRCSLLDANGTNRETFHTNCNGDECTKQYIGWYDVTEVSIHTSSRPSRVPCVAFVCQTIVHHARSDVSHRFEIGRRPTQ